MLDQKHQDLMDELSKLKGSEFDRAYTKDMVSGHEKAIEQFETEVKNGRDSDVKAGPRSGCQPSGSILN